MKLYDAFLTHKTHNLETQNEDSEQPVGVNDGRDDQDADAM